MKRVAFSSGIIMKTNTLSLAIVATKTQAKHLIYKEAIVQTTKVW